MTDSQKGMLAALCSNSLFGVLYIYSSWMKPLSGTDVFAWRILGMWLSLWLFIILTANWHGIFRYLYSVGRDWQKWLLIILPAPILSSQLWLFMWGPVNGYGIDVAMGYFLFPLTMILSGRLFIGERLNRLQWLGLAFAAVGVIFELWQTHAFSWVTIWVSCTYPIYYLTRRHVRIPTLTGLLIDLTITMPFALGYLWYHSGFALLDTMNRYWLLIPLLGIISTAAIQLNLQASSLLSITLFGMLSYIEPILLFILAIIILHTPISDKSIITYSLIWIGLCITLLDGYLKMHATRQKNF